MLQWSMQAAESSPSVEVLDRLLADLVDTTRPLRPLYGGDLRSLISVLADVVDRSTVGLLPGLDAAAIQCVSTNISSVLHASSAIS